MQSRSFIYPCVVDDSVKQPGYHLPLTGLIHAAAASAGKRPVQMTVCRDRYIQTGQEQN